MLFFFAIIPGATCLSIHITHLFRFEGSSQIVLKNNGLRDIIENAMRKGYFQ